jgi:O-antigen ligase
VNQRVVSWLVGIAAGAMAFLLPVTSFPLVARLSGSSMVAPLSLLPLAALVVLWMVPYAWKGGGFPKQVRIFLVFVLAALVSSAAAFFIAFPAYKGASVPDSTLKALATLAVGGGFYIAAAAWAQTPERLRFVLRWVNWGGVAMLAWSFFQAGIWYRLQTNPDWLFAVQGQISTSLLLYGQRVTGLAYEPSWLAHQLNMLYLPLWLASSITGFTAHRFRAGPLHFEHLLLAGGVAVLVLTISRIGLLTFLLMMAFALLLANIALVRWLQRRAARRFHAEPLRERAARRWTALASVAILAVVYAGLAAGAAYGISRYDKRMQRLFDLSTLREQSFMHYANQLVFAERVVFWQAGWEVFNDYPLLGVGLGNSGYFFPEKLSAFSFALTEVQTLIYRQAQLPNIKSLWVRLLAETGVVGFLLMLCWGYVLWKSARFLQGRRDRLFRMAGLAGAFAIIGFVVEGFSLDTFALPYQWVTFGILTAACEIARRKLPHGVEHSGLSEQA